MYQPFLAEFSLIQSILNHLDTVSRAGLYHMQTMQLHRAARKKGAKSGAPEKLRGAKNGRGATKFTIPVTLALVEGRFPD